MKHFLKMIDKLKQPTNPNGVRYGDVERINYPLFNLAIEECQPFVLNYHIEGIDILGALYPSNSKPISSPFKAVSIETLNSSLSLSQVNFNERKLAIETLCVLIYEFEPLQYIGWALDKAVNENTYFYSRVSHNDCMKLLFVLDCALSDKNNQQGIAKPKLKLKLKNQDRHKIYKEIKKVIIINPACNKNNPVSMIEGYPVEFSHRWTVRGHWRKHNGLGKDRAGIYQVPNMTWVTEFEKGNKDLPLVKKVRLVNA